MAGGDGHGPCGMRPQVTPCGTGDQTQVSELHGRTSLGPGPPPMSCSQQRIAPHHWPTSPGGNREITSGFITSRDYWAVFLPSPVPTATPHLPGGTILPAKPCVIPSSFYLGQVRGVKCIAQVPFLEPVTLKLAAISYCTSTLAARRNYVLAEYNHSRPGP